MATGAGVGAVLGVTITWCSKAKLLEATLIASIYYLHSCLCQISQSEVLPKFLAPLGNHTVIQGREVSFTCIVNHLKDYRVAWIKSDSRAILAIHTHLVAHNPRISVTHNGHNTWKLHLSNVQKNDSGTYMCQVNTEPMLSQMGYMEVVVPPDIVDDKSPEGGGGLEGGGGGSEQVANEGGSVKLRCLATGTPEPNVTWRRENNSPIVIRGRPHTHRLEKLDGEFLELNNVTREDMGHYLCIATNGIPPTVSKRFVVLVNFAPTIKARENVVGAPVHTNVVLQCIVEASPAAMNTWLIGKDQKLLPTAKYNMTELQLNEYTWQMNLTIRALNKDDFGDYTCASVNALGTAEEKVRLQKTDAPPTTTTTTPQHHSNRPSNELRPGRKKQQQQNNLNNKKHQHRGKAGGAADELDATRVHGGKTERPGHRQQHQHNHHNNNAFSTSSTRSSVTYDDDDDDDDNNKVSRGGSRSNNYNRVLFGCVVTLLLCSCLE